MSDFVQGLISGWLVGLAAGVFLVCLLSLRREIEDDYEQDEEDLDALRDRIRGARDVA